MQTEAKPFLQDRYLYEEAVMRRVCSHCIDFGEDGVCHSADPKGCAIFRFLPELVAIADEIHDSKIQPYLDRVRADICMKCRSGSPGDTCPMRDTLDCGLDRYLPLVLDAIEEVRKEKTPVDWSQWRQI